MSSIEEWLDAMSSDLTPEGQKIFRRMTWGLATLLLDMVRAAELAAVQAAQHQEE